MSVRAVMQEAGRRYIEQLLQQNEFNVTKTARDAGVNRTDFYKVMKRLGVTYPSQKHVGNWGDLTN